LIFGGLEVDAACHWPAVDCIVDAIFVLKARVLGKVSERRDFSVSRFIDLKMKMRSNNDQLYIVMGFNPIFI
jgi:hypothetical protein